MRKLMTSILSVKCRKVAGIGLRPASKYRARSNVRTVTQLRDQTAQADVALNHNQVYLGCIAPGGGRRRYGASYFKLSHFSLNQFTMSNFAPRVAPNRDVLGIDIKNGSRQKSRGDHRRYVNVLSSFSLLCTLKHHIVRHKKHSFSNCGETVFVTKC